MAPQIEQVLEHLEKDFPLSRITSTPVEGGSVNVIVEPVDLGPRYQPRVTWIGAQLTPGLPYSDVYPLYVGAEVGRVHGGSWQVPISTGHQFEGRPALQISRRTNNLLATAGCAAGKFIKVLHFIREEAQ